MSVIFQMPEYARQISVYSDIYDIFSQKLLLYVNIIVSTIQLQKKKDS